MHSILRALGTAALAVGQSSLTVTENGTYLATVELDSVPVSLLVDTTTSGLWVKCAALERATCADATSSTTSGYTRKLFARVDKTVPVKTKRFAEVKIAGQTFNGFDATVVYHTLPDLHPSIQGVLGLRRRSPTAEIASMYLDNQVTGVMLQLGSTSSDSKIGFDTKDDALLTRKGTQTPVDVRQKMSCFRIPVAANSSSTTTTTEACTTTDTTVYFDPASPRIRLTSTLLYTLERRFLYTCSKVNQGSYQVLHYVCSASVKLPVFTVGMGSWNFTIDPVDYTVPVTSNSSGKQVQVLVGDAESMYSGIVLGAPFLRKYPVFLNASSDLVTVYCTENVTCTKIPSQKLGKATIGGTSGGGGGGGGGGGTSGYDFDGESSSRRNKKTNRIYVGVGLGVGAVLLLVLIAIGRKACQSNEGESEENNDAAKSPEMDEVELRVAYDADHDNHSEVGPCRCKQRDQRAAAAAPAASAKSRNEDTSSTQGHHCVKDGDIDIDIDDDSDSSDEEERRQRRRLRRARRQREAQQHHAAAPPQDITIGTDYYYIHTASPYSKM